MAANGARVHIYGDWDGSAVKKAQQDLGFFEKQTSGISSNFTKSFLGMGAAIGGAFAVGNVIGSTIDFMKEAAQAAIDDEKSVVALKTAMDNVGQGFANSGAERFVKDLSMATGEVDDNLRPALQRLVTATGDTAKAQSLLQTAMDVSAATGKSVVDVSMALSKAYNGNLGALTRMGVPLDASIVKSKDFGAAIDVLNQKFGGQAAAAAETYGGQLKRLQTAAGEAKETIGYALLGAIENVSSAMGGTSGMVGAMDSMSSSMANVITAIGGATAAIIEYGKQTTVAQVAGEENAGTVAAIGGAMLAWAPAIPIVGGLAGVWKGLSDAGQTLNDVTKRQADEVAGVTALYAGYKANSDRAHSSTVAMATAAETAADALKKTKEAISAINAAISGSQSLDDFRYSLAHLDETLKGVPRSLEGMGKGAKTARDTLRDEFGKAADIVQGWVDDGKIKAEDFKSNFNTLAKQIVAKFKAQGFKQSDIEQFLASEGIWSSSIMKNVRGAAAAVSGAGKQVMAGVGRDLAMGVAAGVAAAQGPVNNSVRTLLMNAHGAARAAIESHSPSQLFAREVGAPIAQGIAKGIKDESNKAIKAAVDLVKGMADAAISPVSEMIDSARSEVMDGLKRAQDDVALWVGNMRDQLLSGFDIGTAYNAAIGEDGKVSAQAWLDGVNKQIADMGAFSTVLETIKANGGSQALIDYLASKGVEAGTGMGQALIDNGLIGTMSAKMAEVQASATATAQSMVPSFLQSGLDSAQATVNSFIKKFGPGGEGASALQTLMSALADSMRRETTITVTTINRSVNEVVSAVGNILPKRAAGGPVTGGMPYIVGEKGPELFIPSNSGDIIPNGTTAGGSAIGGNTYNVTVQAGVGDPRQIGQQVVEYIKRFEQSNGAVFAAA